MPDNGRIEGGEHAPETYADFRQKYLELARTKVTREKLGGAYSALGMLDQAMASGDEASVQSALENFRSLAHNAPFDATYELFDLSRKLMSAARIEWHRIKGP